MRYHLIVPAAGSGRRFAASTPKQYASLAGATVLEHSLSPFIADADCAGIVVAIAADDSAWAGIGRRLGKVTAVTGGEQRAHSVLQALLALRQALGANDWVLVHDAARPCIHAEDIQRLKRDIAEHPAGGLLAIPLSDTLKRGEAGTADVAGTVERSGLWRAATPQAFRLGVLLPALEAAIAANRLPTDEAQAVEWAGHRPRLVAGRADNIKVTTPEDLLLASAILSTRGKT